MPRTIGLFVRIGFMRIAKPSIMKLFVKTAGSTMAAAASQGAPGKRKAKTV